MVDNGLPRSLTKCFVFNVESHAFMTRTRLATIWHIFCVCFDNGLPRSVMCQFNFYSFRQRVAPIYLKRQSLREKNLHRSPGNGTFFFHLARFSCELRQRVAPICHDLGWLVRLETSRLLHNLSFWSLSTLRTQFSFPVVSQGDLWWRAR